MPIKVITKKIESYIQANFLKESGKSMARKFGVSATAVQRYMRKNGLAVPKELVHKFRTQGMVGRTTFTDSQDAFIRENYLSLPIKALAFKIGRSYTGVIGRLAQMGLSIPPEVIERNRQSGLIKVGNEPFNKGKKQSDFMSPEAIRKTSKTRFKKGNLPHNTAQGNGEIRIRETKGRPYKHIRISLGKWVHLHKHLWENKNGPVPSGHCLWARDGNSLNTDPDNWELITRKENRIRNSGTITLSDNRVSFYLSPKDKSLRKEIKANHSGLIELKRNQLLLNREINEKL